MTTNNDSRSIVSINRTSINLNLALIFIYRDMLLVTFSFSLTTLPRQR